LENVLFKGFGRMPVSRRIFDEKSRKCNIFNRTSKKNVIYCENEDPRFFVIHIYRTEAFLSWKSRICLWKSPICCENHESGVFWGLFI